MVQLVKSDSNKCRRRWWRGAEGIGCLILAAMVLLMMTACKKDPLSAIIPTLVNERDRFHFRLNDAVEVDTALVYYWPMDGTSANIDQQAVISSGQARITIEDNTQVQVYETDMDQNGSFQTRSGAPGGWRIRITLTNLNGLVDFRAQRR